MLATNTPRAARAAPRARDRPRRGRPVAYRGNGADSSSSPSGQAPLPPRPASPLGPLALPVKPLTTSGAALTAEESASLARVLQLAPAATAAAAAAAASAPSPNPRAAPSFPPAPLQRHLLQTLESAAQHGASPDLPLLEGAILAAEQLFLQQQQQQQQQAQAQAQEEVVDEDAPATAATANDPLAAATRPRAVAASARAAPRWQPVFASSGGWPRLLFIPVPEFFVGTSADPAADGAFDVVTELPGNITTHFYGERRWGQQGGAGEGGGGGGGAHVLEYEVQKVRVEWTGGGGGGASSALPPGVTIPLPGPLRLRNALAFFAATPKWALARSRLGGTMLLRADPPAARKYGRA
jgi:hypothetical protein